MFLGSKAHVWASQRPGGGPVLAPPVSGCARRAIHRLQCVAVERRHETAPRSRVEGERGEVKHTEELKTKTVLKCII